MFTAGSTNGPVPQRRVEVRNVVFGGLSVLPADQQTNIIFEYRSYMNDQVVKDEMVVYGYNGMAGDDFQIYYPQQAPDFIVPQSTNDDPISGGLSSARPRLA
jgi:hypothetical protein